MSLCVQAQIINIGLVYTGLGRQQATQSYIDKIGNRYQVILYNTDFIIDSVSKPITIKKNPNSYLSSSTIAIIKYDTNGRYLYHIKFFSTNGFDEGQNQTITLGFNTSNEVYIYCRFLYRDSVDLIDANNLLYKRVKGNNTINMGLYYTAILSKLMPNGQFSWVNSIARENKVSFNTPQSYQFNSLIVNSVNDVTIQFNNIRAVTATLPDTFSITNAINQKSIAVVSTQDILFKFSAMGVILSVKEPLKNRLSGKHYDSMYYNIYRAVTDGHNTYSINRVYISTPDTFKCATPLPLKLGDNILLIKTNEQDSIIWAKSLGIRQNQLSKNSNYLLDYDTIFQELVIGTNYIPSLFQFTHNPLLSNNKTDVDIYVAKLNTNGNIKWEEVFSGNNSDFLYSLTYNNITKQLILIGNTLSTDFKAGNFVLPCVTTICNYYPTGYVICIDSLNVIYSAQVINGNSITINTTKMGYPITDLKGRTYLSGSFTDSIQLPCSRLRAILDVNQFGQALSDGFVLILGADIPKNVEVCKSMTSPSGKYLWNNDGIYYDTIPSRLGCDSVILFSLKTLQSKSNFDSIVCNRMKSYSGKYTWSNSGMYYDTIPNTNSCDSIIALHLTVLQSNNSIINTSMCKNVASPSGKYTYSISGVYQDTIKNSIGCDSVITINLTIKPLSLNVSKSNNISCDSPFASLSVYGGDTFLWHPAIGLSNINIYNPTAKPDTNTLYYVSVKDTLGCTAKDSIEILVNKLEQTHALCNVFTPNEDGINDCVALSSITQFKEVEFIVFNRWGETVFTTDNPTDCWNGKLNSNQDLTEGVYFYILEGKTNCENKLNQRGVITIIR